MSNDWSKDIKEMHKKFGVHKWVQAQQQSDVDDSKLKDFLKFRMKMVQEEVDETNNAINDKNPEEIVDGLIDMCVFAIGTLDVFGIDANKAWNEILNANMSKDVGIKESRPNPFGLPDLIKPKDWKSPDHNDNHGILSKAL
jgi:predicted HAD superfamily Cof-like phosphohydrolase|tara:strand:+ start:6453 stop:6875 length:423 start_codon:yes stop_codon:yes gene_type:complete